MTHAILLWITFTGTLTLGSSPMEIAKCEARLTTDLLEIRADRDNFGQKNDKPATWISHGFCVLVAGKGWTNFLGSQGWDLPDNRPSVVYPGYTVIR